MNITPLTTDLNAHQNLADQPTLTASELKVAWDKPANDIKTYLNNVLIDDVEGGVADAITEAKAYTDTAVAGISLTASNISYDNTSSSLTADDTQEAIDELNTNIGSLTTTVGNKLIYSDFATTSTTITKSFTPGQKRFETIVQEKSGYYPLGIVGETNNQEAVDVRDVILAERGAGTTTISYHLFNEDYGNNRTATISFEVLWVKIS